MSTATDEIVMDAALWKELLPKLGKLPRGLVRTKHSTVACSTLYVTTPAEVFPLVSSLPKRLREWKVAIAITPPRRGQSPASREEAIAFAHEHLPAKTPIFPAPDADAIRRMIFARSVGAGEKLIASAAVIDDQLIAWSCEPQQYVCPLDKLPGVKDLPASRQREFVLSESGGRISWPSADTDLDLDAIRARCDEDYRKERDRRIRQETSNYAVAIRELREQRGLKQSGIEGVSEREVRRIEKGEQVPRLATLKKLARAHQMSVDEYLEELAARSESVD